MDNTLLTNVAFDKYEFRMYCNDRPVDNIIIYNETGKYFNFHHGFIEVLGAENKYKVSWFIIDKVRNTRECNMSSHDNFLLEEDDPILDKVYTLYIFNGKGITISNIREVRCLETIDAVSYTIHADINFKRGGFSNGVELEGHTLVTPYCRIIREEEKENISSTEKKLYNALNKIYVMTDNKEISSLIADCLQIKIINEV